MGGDVNCFLLKRRTTSINVYTIILFEQSPNEFHTEELQILDENTVQYMIDDMQDQIDAQAAAIQELQQLVKSLQGNVDV